MNKLIVTKFPEEQQGKHPFAKGKIVSALIEDGNLAEVNCTDEADNRILGNIYIGRVQNVVDNIRAAFVEIGKDQVGYYSFEDNRAPIFTNKKRTSSTDPARLCIGDELLVQVSKENLKSKAPVVTSNLNFSGKYLVLTTGNRRVGTSAKLSKRQKKRMRELMDPHVTEEYGFVIRTNAAEAAEEEILQELNLLISRYQRVVQIAPSRVCYSKLEEALPEYIANLRDAYMSQLEQIVTDDEKLYADMKAYLEAYQPEDLEKLVFYQDNLLSLAKLHSLEVKIKEALKERVWLKSGGYLVIQPTEALVVVDVNTGKFSGKKNLQQTFLKINLEAAAEIARQLRLRNLSGIVIIDFIDMEREEDQQRLLEELAHRLSQDPVKTTLIGMSPLHLVELTRKKGKKPLHDLFASECPTCHGSGYLY